MKLEVMAKSVKMLPNMMMGRIAARQEGVEQVSQK